MEWWVRCAALAALWMTVSTGARAESITGVCPDGSVYIVQQQSAIPCRDSKRVAPSEVPPVRPEYLPIPYTWQVYNELQNPNNPYNLIDPAREVRALNGTPPLGAETAGEAEAATARELPSADIRPEEVLPLSLGFSDAELSDLYQIVTLSQQYVPATLERDTADGRGVFHVRFARSTAFESRLREAWAAHGGLEGSSVLLFTANSKRPEVFHANFTLVQDHLTFQPLTGDTSQFGLLAGRLGALDGDELVLGYVVLPDHMDATREMDIYWNDRRITVRF